jgi:hypothetical protein
VPDLPRPKSPNGPHAATIEQHTHHQRGSAASECVRCHMPAIAQTIADVNVRSHTFKFITPAMTEALKIPNACTSLATRTRPTLGDRRAAQLAGRVAVAHRALMAGGGFSNRRPLAHESFRPGRGRGHRLPRAVARYRAGTVPLRILCTPELKIEPTFTVEDLFQRPAIETLENGRVVETNRVERETVFELIFALDVPTEIPRVSLTFEAIFIPFGQTSANPFTGEEAGDEVAAIRDKRHRDRIRAQFPLA